MRLYRKGFAQDLESSWFPTILEAINYDSKEKGSDEIIGVMWIGPRNFFKHFEPSGVGYKPKSGLDFAKSGATTQYHTLERLRELLEDPITSRIYHDGQFN